MFVCFMQAQKKNLGEGGLTLNYVLNLQQSLGVFIKIRGVPIAM